MFRIVEGRSDRSHGEKESDNFLTKTYISKNFVTIQKYVDIMSLETNKNDIVNVLKKKEGVENRRKVRGR